MSTSHYAGSQLAVGVFIFLCVIRRHFLACEDIAGGSELSAAVFILCGVIRTHFLACEDVSGGSQQSGGENINF